MKKVLKVIIRLILILILLLVIAVLACFFYQKNAQKKDRQLLEEGGYSNLVSAGEFRMNVNIFGDGKYKIIAMPGAGDAWFPVDMKQFSEHLSDDISLVVVSRPGYGLCEETDKDVTTEYIVESTRTALKNAGVEAPYILMPHSLSGIYGTYWESTYPDEVSGVVFLDSVNEAHKEFDEYAEADIGWKIFSKSGLARVYVNKSGILMDHLSPKLGEDAKYASAFYTVNDVQLSASVTSEMKNENANMKTAWAAIKSNDIPKVYISTNFETMDDVKEYLKYENGEVNEDEFKRKVRMNRIILRFILPDVRILNPFAYHWFTYFYLGHRTCRYLLWIMHLISLVVSVPLAIFGSLFWKIALILQLLFYFVALVGWATKSGNKLIKIVFYYCMTVIAQWKGVINIITGKAKPVWEKAESTR